MSLVTHNPSKPQSSGEFPIADPARVQDIERKQQRITEYLQSQQLDALLLQRPANLAWFTSGGNCLSGSGEPRAALLITADSRVVVCNNVDSGELFDKELSGLGFLLKQRPWHEAPHVLVDDVCRGRTVASDTGYGDTRDMSALLSKWRMTLEAVECDRLRELGRIVTHAVEATARTIEPGQTEAEIAGQLAHRLIKHQASPLKLQVIADSKVRQYRHYEYSDVPLRKWCVLSATASRWGLCCRAARTVSFGNLTDELADAFQKTCMVLVTGRHASRAGAALSDILSKVRRIYEKVGQTEEWQLCDQGAVSGYQPCESPLVPGSQVSVGAQMVMHWHPSVGPAMMGETILVSDRLAEVVTRHDQWPSLQFAVQGTKLSVPDMLLRE